ncbi:Hpt domain-containing protein [Rhodocaloribacter litoris]|uniref:Hpt domain-containing protein n=1 Tax=Rhodocaloribacter litoris TaxID=2558931 RepID=UPI00141DC745|nr:Hpt domain-containing protein [Rhodocaloribacter litoris]QXD16008.1 Hpt domain-containing protein [Rhodocaloribacter litoris]
MSTLPAKSAWVQQRPHERQVEAARPASGATHRPDGGDGTAIPLLQAEMIEELRQLDEGQGVFLGELVEAFLLHAAELFERVERACAAGDRAGLTGAVHNLKGAGLNMGATALGLHCRQLEKRLRAGETLDMAAELDVLRVLYARTCAALRQLTAAPGG